MSGFGGFLDKKTKSAKYELGVIYRILKEEGKFHVRDFTNEIDPYLFVKGPEDLSFGGIRIYRIGKKIVYRTQMREDTHPFGSSYSLDLNDFFNTLVSDDMNEEEAGEEVIRKTIEEINNFFSESRKAEKEIKVNKVERDRIGTVVDAPTADFSNTVHIRNT